MSPRIVCGALASSIDYDKSTVLGDREARMKPATGYSRSRFKRRWECN